MVNTLIRTKRKTFSLEVTEDALVVLRVPERASEKSIREFVKKSAQWIERHKTQALKKQKERPVLVFEEGAYVPYLGMSFPIRVTAQKRPRMSFHGRFLLSGAYKNRGKEEFEKWAKGQAKKVFEQRAGRPVRVSSAKKRWGSCAPDGGITLTWRLILAPIWVLDYVLAHETAHIIHKNHGKRFWAKVKKLYPRYKEAERWLKEHGHLLSV